MRRSKRILDKVVQTKDSSNNNNDNNNNLGEVSCSAGLTMSTEQLVPVSTGGPPQEHRRRRGAVSRMVTASAADPSAAEPTGCLVEPTASLTLAGLKRQRMKWSKELNTSLMHTYYTATNLESEMEGHRARLVAEWRKVFSMSTLTEQHLCSQVRSVVTGKRLSAAELENIKVEVRQKLSPVETDDLNSSNVSVLQSSVQSEDQLNIDTNADQQQQEPVRQKLLELYSKHKLEYLGNNIKTLPMIPKPPINKRLYEYIVVMNELLDEDLREDTSLVELVSLTYCATLSICKCIGINIPNNLHWKTSKRGKVKQRCPSWVTKILDRINGIRRDIAHIQIFLRKSFCKRKVISNIRMILRHMGENLSSQDVDKKLMKREEYFKQRIAALGARIRRFNKSAKRRRDQRLFAENQKLFFGRMEETVQHPSTLPSKEELSSFWSNIWSIPVEHDKNVFWEPEIQESNQHIPEMLQSDITLDDVVTAIKKTQNWKAPGCDGIRNFWWKKLPATHRVLTYNFNKILRNPKNMPYFMTEGITYMKYKSGDAMDPKNYRPITCLPTVYKIFTSVLSSKIYNHVIQYNILASEQNGSRRGSRGCKEMLVIDSIITTQVKKRHRNISVGWIDYKKAYDSIPHSWLLKVLYLYNIDPAIINVLKFSMEKWRTSLMLGHGTKVIQTDVIHIRRGIFQGDSLSPLWFCLALNPLSQMLHNTLYGYNIDRSQAGKISHQFYMDDLKLFAKNRDELQSMLELVKSFSDGIHMEFGLDKCRIINVKKGIIIGDQQHLILKDGSTIMELGPEETYKYLGLQQLLQVKDTDMRQLVEKRVLARIQRICRTELSARNKISAINTWAVPIAVYTFGVLHWSDTALRTFDRKIRSVLSRYRMHHPRSSTHRLYLPRSAGGRGLLCLETMCKTQCTKLRQYFFSKWDQLVSCVQRQKLTVEPLNLHNPDFNIVITSATERQEEWRQKKLHGRFAECLTSEHVDIVWSTEWLRTSGLFGETEGFIFGIQDQVINTRAYERHIINANINDKCRLCRQKLETISHITSGCGALSQVDYRLRHDNVAKVVHQALAKHLELVEKEAPYYKCKPDQVMQKGQVRLFWDSPIVTDRSVEANRPDILIINKNTKSAVIVDIAVPQDENLVSTITEKQRKYQSLAVELKDIYRLEKVDIIPVVVSVNGLVTHDWEQLITKLPLKTYHLRMMQKAALLGTARIVRKVLSL